MKSARFTYEYEISTLYLKIAAKLENHTLYLVAHVFVTPDYLFY